MGREEESAYDASDELLTLCFAKAVVLGAVTTYLDVFINYVANLGEVQIRSEEFFALLVFEVDDVVVGAFIVADVYLTLEKSCVND